MKRSFYIAALLLFFFINASDFIVRAQGTVFTYQGRLNNGSNAANGLYDFQFALSNAPSGGSQIGGTVTSVGVSVSNGLFTTTIDFGKVLTGQSAWLALGVRTNGGSVYVGLAPLQALTPTPYAIFANSASNVSGTVNGDGSGLTNVNVLGSQVTSIAGLTGNYFLGSAGNPASGSWNTGLGNSALQFNNGSGNTAVGYLTLQYVDNGGENTAVGLDALSSLMGASENTAVGAGALSQLGSGNHNLAIGDQAGFNMGNAESYDIDIGNSGVGGDDHVIRIGDAQTSTFIAGVINGNGGGLTNLSAASIAGVALTGSANTFTTDQTVNGQITAGGSAGAMTLLDRFHPVNDFGWQWRADATGLNASRFNGGAGAQYFTISTNGQFGIGTTAPVKPLEVAANAAGVAAGNSIDSSVFLRVDNTASDGNTTSPDYAGIGFGHNSTRQAIVGGTFGNDYLDFYTSGTLTAPRLRIDFNGNIGMGTTTISHPLDMASGAFCSVAGVWTSVSDRNVKEDFTLISPGEVLSKVAAMPITEWKYKVEPSGTEHIGPMAQDFHAAFGLNGEDDKHISTIDESGVALVAIQGLNEKMEQLRKTLDERDAAYATLKQQNAAMEQKLNELQQLVQANLKRP